MTPLELGLPEGPVPWWEVRVEYPDGDAPWPPAGYPPDMMAAHTPKLTIVRLQAGRGSAALAKVEDWLGVTGGTWTVSLVTPGDVLVRLCCSSPRRVRIAW